MQASNWFQLGANCEAVFLLLNTNLELRYTLQPNAFLIRSSCTIRAADLKDKIQSGNWTSEEAHTWCEELKMLMVWYRALKAIEKSGEDVKSSDMNFNPLAKFNREIDFDQKD